MRSWPHPPPHTELHVVGVDPARPDCERRASLGAGGQQVKFHGAVPHLEIPTWIAAADVCLAPYNPAFFPGGEVSYSILKIREYLSSGRGVVSIPSGAILELVQDGRTGFLFPNEVASWRKFLASPPSRERLRSMGEVAARTELPSWDDVGERVHELIQQVVRGSSRGVAV